MFALAWSIVIAVAVVLCYGLWTAVLKDMDRRDWHGVGVFFIIVAIIAAFGWAGIFLSSYYKL